LANQIGGEAGLIAQSPVMMKLLRQADAIAAGDIAVLIRGETGTGKEKLAERLHAKSPRAHKPFVAVNCSSLKPELLESELFGYKKGAFTGAHQDRPGLFTAAHGGTLFLDELGEMDLGLQAKLLRALESGRIRPVGALQEETVNVRLVCATNRDLNALVAEKTFREDLFFRVAQVELSLPPLRDREEDIALLSHSFLERFKDRYPAKELRGFHPDSLTTMTTYAWPGNVRELQNLVHKGVLLSEGPWVVLELGYGPAGEVPNTGFLAFEEATQRFQRQHLARALDLSGGNREQAAKLAQMPRSTFFRHLSQLGIGGGQGSASSSESAISGGTK
jgi:two-component system response regulator GlrR